MCKFRTLNPDEVELRVAQSGKRQSGQVWAQYLIYKDARVDQRVLDETVGSLRWQKSYEMIEGRLYCTVSIYDPELKQWISKQDVGTESNTEKEKGQASDAFKRACFNWGIGRELYSAPDIFITLNAGEYTERDGRAYPKNNLFSVQEMNVDEETRKITSLVIIDRNLNIRFQYPNGVRNAAQKQPVMTDVVSGRQRPTPAQLKQMAVRIANGEDLTENIKKHFAMFKEDYRLLDEYISQQQTNK